MGDSGNKLSLFQNLKKLASDIACFEIRLPAELPSPDKLREIIHDFLILCINVERGENHETRTLDTIVKKVKISLQVPSMMKWWP